MTVIGNEMHQFQAVPSIVRRATYVIPGKELIKQSYQLLRCALVRQTGEATDISKEDAATQQWYYHFRCLQFHLVGRKVHVMTMGFSQHSSYHTDIVLKQLEASAML